MIDLTSEGDKITLEKHEIEGVTPLARELYYNHHFKDSSSYPAQLVGMLGEFAAIKYFNLLGANPKVKLNRNYDANGFDGGFDFAWPHDKIKWDVKTTVKDYIDQNHLRTKAGLIIGVKMIKLSFFLVWGFAKVSELPNRNIGFSDFTSLFSLKSQFPNYFTLPNQTIDEFKKQNDFSHIGDIILNNTLDTVSDNYRNKSL